ncbi:MAG: phosphoglycerate dehydrogenase [Chloroflexota bacterium]
MAKPRILVTTRFLKPGDEIEDYLEQAGLETVFRRVHNEDEMIAALKGFDAIICSSDPLSARVIESADKLKVISRTGVGYNTIDVKAATAMGIPVCLTPGNNRHAVAEWTFTLMLACARKLLENLAEVQKGGWSPHDGVELAGKTLGIVGLGIIGKEVAQRAKAFEMRILANDLVLDKQFAEAYGVTYVPLEQLLPESDFVTLHTFIDARSHHLINTERLALMKPTAFLINTSRGGVVDAAALYQALKEKRIAGAGLDVQERETLEESQLRELPNVLITPHAGAATEDYRSQCQLSAAEAVIRVLQGQRPAFALNPEVFK